MELTRELTVATEAARRAGAVLLEHYSGAALPTRSKDRRQEVVTAADEAAEAVVLAALRTRWPHDAVLAEESGLVAGRSSRCWYVDPLDGTANFAAGIAHWAVAIALLVDGHPVLAVTLDPYRDELFVASAGGPCTLNEQPLRVADVARVEDALIAVNLPYAARGRGAVGSRMYAARGLRESGAMALDLAWVAAGRMHLEAHARSGSAWDYAGGEYLVERAGGAVRALPGEPGLVVTGAAPLLDDLTGMSEAVASTGHHGGQQ